MPEVDELDLKILEMLQENGRDSFTEIGEKLQLNESTIRKRVRSLQRREVIKKFTVEIDPSKIGMRIVAIVGVDVDPTRLLEAAQKLCEIEEVQSVATSTGDHMILTEIWSRNGRELTRLISEEIGTISGVKKICPAIILEKMKSRYPELDVKEYNIGKSDNLILQFSYFKYYDVPPEEQGTLGVFIKDKYFVDPDKLEDGIEDEIKKNYNGKLIIPHDLEKIAL